MARLVINIESKQKEELYEQISVGSISEMLRPFVFLAGKVYAEGPKNSLSYLVRNLDEVGEIIVKYLKEKSKE